ncbi:MAG: methanogenesis marker protein Mmp4/MtxX [Halobacteriota archaeon]
MSEIFRRFVAIADQSKNTVGVGVGPGSLELIQGIECARHHARIVLVGNEEIEGWELVKAEEPERTLVELLLNGTIDAAVRGTVSARKALQILKEQAGFRRVHRSALLSTLQGTEFFLVPVGVDEGNSVREQAYLATKTAELLGSVNIAPKVGVLSGGRAEDKGRARTVDRTLERAEQLTRRLSASGIDATNYGILIEEAAQSSNVLVAPDGIIGNLIFRTLTFLGGGKGYGAPLLGIPHTFVDTSRSGSAFGNAIIMASALSNLAQIHR